jgi:hypothetical protein
MIDRMQARILGERQDRVCTVLDPPPQLLLGDVELRATETPQ